MFCGLTLTITLHLNVQVDPSTIWLREEFGQRAFFPDAINQFHFPSEVGLSITSLVVEGSQTRPISAPEPTAAVCIPGPSTYASPVYKPIFSSKKEQSLKVKIIQAKMKKHSGRPEFTSMCQTYVTITEATASLDYVTTVIQRKWGSQYVLVTSDGLKLDDSAQGTHVHCCY